MKKTIFQVITAMIIFSTSCTEKNNSPTLDPSTPITINGTTYTSKGFSYFDFGGGYIDFMDSAISDDGTRILWVNMSFNLSASKPSTGNYSIFTDSTSLVNSGAVEFNFYENTLSGKSIYTYKILSPGSGVVTATNIDNQVSYYFGAQTLIGIPYDTVTSVSNGPAFNCNLSAATITEE